MFDAEFLVPLGFFALVGYIAKLIADTRIRRKAIEAHMATEDIEELLNQKSGATSTTSALKWGLIVLALGVGLLMVEVLRIGFESPVAYALLLLATGFALIGYYLLEREDHPQPGEGPVPPGEAPSPESVGGSEL